MIAIRNGATMLASPISAEARIDQPGQGEAEAAAPAGRQALDRAAREQAGGGADQHDAEQGEDQRAQPAARLAAARERAGPATSISGRIRPIGGPATVSSRSEVQAPALPIQLPTGPPASVLSEGSLGPVADQRDQREQRGQADRDAGEEAARCAGAARFEPSRHCPRRPGRPFCADVAAIRCAPNVPRSPHAPCADSRVKRLALQRGQR